MWIQGKEEEKGISEHCPNLEVKCLGLHEKIAFFRQDLLVWWKARHSSHQCVWFMNLKSIAFINLFFITLHTKKIIYWFLFVYTVLSASYINFPP